MSRVGPHRFGEQALPPWRRAVLKVGSSLLAADGGGLTSRNTQAIADFVAACHAAATSTRGPPSPRCCGSGRCRW